MSSIRIARAALRARSAVIARPVQRRGYADAVSDKIKLSLALPHSVRYTFRAGDDRITISRKPVLTNVFSRSTSQKMCTNYRLSLISESRVDKFAEYK